MNKGAIEISKSMIIILGIVVIGILALGIFFIFDNKTPVTNEFSSNYWNETVLNQYLAFKAHLNYEGGGNGAIYYFMNNSHYVIQCGSENLVNGTKISCIEGQVNWINVTDSQPTFEWVNVSYNGSAIRNYQRAK